MKLASLLAFFALACTTPHPPTDDGPPRDSGAGGSSGGMPGVAYSTCPQHRVEGIECAGPSSAGGVLRKNGLRCASCSGVDATGTPTEKPIGCKTVAGGDLCVADCSECS